MATPQPGVKRFPQPLARKNVSPSVAATEAIRRLAEAQHGVVCVRQLKALGLSESLILERVGSGRLIQLHRGVFALGHRQVGVRGEWMAAVLACGPDAVLSHGSAAQLWGIRDSRGPIEVTRFSGHRRPHGVWLHQTRSLEPELIATEASIPVTSLERTLLDLAPRLNDRQLERTVVAADKTGRLRWPELMRLAVEARGRKGLRRFRRVVVRVDPSAVNTRSPLEVDFLALCREAGLPTPQVNVAVEGRTVDFHWPKQRLIVETDGYRYHDDRPAFERDHESTVALMNAGYTVLRATYRMLQRDPEPFLQLIRRSLAA